MHILVVLLLFYREAEETPAAVLNSGGILR